MKKEIHKRQSSIKLWLISHRLGILAITGAVLILVLSVWSYQQYSSKKDITGRWLGTGEKEGLEMQFGTDGSLSITHAENDYEQRYEYQTDNRVEQLILVLEDGTAYETFQIELKRNKLTIYWNEITYKMVRDKSLQNGE